MHVTVNGNAAELAEAEATVRGLMESMRYTFPLVIVKVNEELVPRERWAETRLSEGDVVDAYHLVSGG